MSNRRTFTLAALTALVLAAIVPIAATTGTAASPPDDAAVGETLRDAATSLTDVRVTSASDGRPAVTLRGDGPFDVKSFVLERPDRLVLDLKGVTSHLSTHQIPVGDGGVLRVRAGQFRVEPVPVTRVVVDLD